MRTKPSFLVLLLALGLSAVACGGGATLRPVGAAGPSCSGNDRGGDAVSPALGVKGGTRYLFRCDRPAVSVQKASVGLANLVANIHGLGSAGLKSTKGAAAVILQEDDPSVPWGTHLLEAERRIFQAFAADRSMGDWLILVTDVVVHAAQDPIPPTGYRWTRQEVQAYVACGIPANGSNDCKTTFFMAADQVVLAPQGGQPHGR